mgnify:FL=1
MKSKLQNMVWPANCTFDNGIDGFEVIGNRMNHREELGLIPPVDKSPVRPPRNHIRLAINGDPVWTTSNGG